MIVDSEKKNLDKVHKDLKREIDEEKRIKRSFQIVHSYSNVVKRFNPAPSSQSTG